MLLVMIPVQAWGQETPLNAEAPVAASSGPSDTPPDPSIFDDKQQLNGFTEHYRTESKDVIMAMIKDDALDPYRAAAAVRVLREKYIDEIFSREKILLEKTLLRRLSRSASPFVDVEIMHTLCLINRYRYFGSMVPALIQKLDHYNSTVNELAYAGLKDLTSKEHTRAREARIVFHSLRRVLFLSRRRLANVVEPSTPLQQKLELLRWSIKILGTDQLNRLPREVIHLL